MVSLLVCFNCVLPSSICSVPLDTAFVRNRRGTYLQRSGAENHFWAASEMCHGAPGGIMSID